MFSIDTHGLVLRYRVISIRSVDPSDTSALAIEPGRDLATLATCTGTGNSRRLLVTGERYTPRGHASDGVDWGGAVRTAGSVAAAGCLVGLPRLPPDPAAPPHRPAFHGGEAPVSLGRRKARRLSAAHNPRA